MSVFQRLRLYRRLALLLSRRLALLFILRRALWSVLKVLHARHWCVPEGVRRAVHEFVGWCLADGVRAAPIDEHWGPGGGVQHALGRWLELDVDVVPSTVSEKRRVSMCVSRVDRDGQP